MKHYLFGRTRAAHIQFFRYFFVGGSSAVVDFTVYVVATLVFDVHYLIANVLAFCFGFSWNYIFSIIWVFESKHHRAKEISMVFVIAALGLLWTELLLWIFVDFGNIHHIIAKVIATWVVLFWNFGMRKFYVFH